MAFDHAFLLRMLLAVFLGAIMAAAPVPALAVPAVITGRVLGLGGPVPGARVSAYVRYEDIKAGRPLAESAPADVEGRYRLALEPGRHFLVARGSRGDEELFAYHGNNPVRVEGDTWVTLLANRVTALRHAEGAPGLKGIVTYKGKPVGDAYLSIYKSGTSTFKGLGFRTGSVDSGGRFDVPLQPGSYVVIAKRIAGDRGNRPPREGDLYCYAPGNPLEVPADTAVTVEVPCYPKDSRETFVAVPPLKPPGLKPVEHTATGGRAGLAGTVRDPSGTPLPEMLVLAYPATKPVFLTYHLSHGSEHLAETGADGSFFIPLEKSGDYYLVARERLGDGPHRGELFGLYNGTPRHAVTFDRDAPAVAVDIVAERVMDERGGGQTASVPREPAQPAVTRPPLQVGDSVLAADTVWDGEILVSGVVLVKKGVTLTIRPGSTIRFRRIDRDRNGVGDGELRVEGRVIARGTHEKRIVFTSAEENRQVRDWSYVHLLASGSGNAFAYCRFEYGFSGIQVHYSTVSITDSIFSRNHEGLHFNTANVTAEHNTFENNGSAIRFKRLEGNVLVSGSEIFGNEIGVLFGRQQINAVDFEKLNTPVDYPRFIGNNFHNNGKYNFSMGEGQNLDIGVPGNWWGSDRSERIEAGIFDRASDNSLGTVLYRPFLAAPAAGAGVRQTPGDPVR